MNIRDTHAALAALLETLTITEPLALGIRKAWKFVPPSNNAVVDLPCTFSKYELKKVVFGPALLQRQYAINIQLLAGKADMQGDIASDIASAFCEALVQKLLENQRLSGTVANIIGLRGASPDTLTTLNWAGLPFVGLDLYLDVLLSDTAVGAAA